MVMNPHGAQIRFIASLLHDADKRWAPIPRVAATDNVESRNSVRGNLGELHGPKPLHSPRKVIDFRPWLAGDNTQKGV